MVRVRKLVLAITAASALTSGMAQALGLGEVTLKSALNQPLVAEIELLEVRELALGDLIPTLAAPEEFSKAGVDRQYFLTDLKFTPVIKPGGKSFIRVTSSKPVREPYLNFLVEVLWPSGRLLREYTLLLDPPLYSSQSTVAPAPQLPLAAPRAPAAPAPRSTAPVAPAPAAVPAAPSVSQLQNSTEYRTTGRDTLWEIAERANPGGSVHQTMLAIQDLNPDAFLDGNINRLKRGQVLRLPDEQQVRNRTQSEALAQVAAQNGAWRDSRGVASAGTRQLDATKRSEAGAAPSQTTTQDSLKLVSPEAGQSTAGSEAGAGGNSKALNDQLAVTKESLDSTRRENDELKGRMTDLQSQLDKLQRLMQLKDDQLAKLQADLAAKGSQPAAAPAGAASAAAAPAPIASASSAPAPAAEPNAAVPAESATPAAPDYNYQEPAAGAAAEATPPAATEPAPVTEPAPAAPEAAAPAPVVEAPVAPVQPVATPAAEEPQASFIDEVTGNPILLGLLGGGALLLLLLLLMALSRRNAQKEAQLQNSLSGPDDDTPLYGEPVSGVSEFDDLDTAGIDVPDTVEERVTAQTGDVLGEADIYIAYGRFTQAAELLQNAINEEPQRSDLRLKLMEVFAELGDRDGFARQENELREIGGAQAEVESLKAKYPAMASLALAGFTSAAVADDEFNLDDLSLDSPSAPLMPAPEEEFDLNLDELEAELERDMLAGNPQQPLQSSDLDSTFDLDFDKPSAAGAYDELSFDLELGNEAAQTSLDENLEDYTLDLGAETKAPAYEEDEFLLSLDDEPNVAPTTDFSELNTASPADHSTDFDLANFDLSLADDEPVPVPAPTPVPDSFAAQLDEVNAELDQLAKQDEAADFDGFEAVPVAASDDDLDGDDEFDFLSGTDETATKLDLARAYIDMGDTEGARDILDEVMTEGSDGQQNEARELLARLA